MMLSVIATAWLMLGQADAQVTWPTIPTNDAANQLLTVIRQDQPNYSDLPDGSTYNYIWAEHMMAWMVAERTGLMSTNECNGRLTGLLGRVKDWQTYHGFYYDNYNSTTGVPTTDKVYFQSWWFWALILAREGYPAARPAADEILARVDYTAAGMVSEDKKSLAADKFVNTGQVSFYFAPSGDVAGELRTAFIAYTWLTGDVTPWMLTAEPPRITVGGQQVLSVWHKFTFDPFYVHSSFPEFGYFEKSWDNLKVGAASYRSTNGMTFYATRMEPLEAWNENPTEWPNTEHRVAKPWTAWLTTPSSPVMARAWIANYGLSQYFDNWNFYWGYGTVTTAHSKVIGNSGSTTNGVFELPFQLETLPGDITPSRPPKMTKVVLNVRKKPGQTPSAPLLVKLNGTTIAQVSNSSNPSLTSPTTLTISNSPTALATNVLTLETAGTGAWEIGATPSTYRNVRWRSNGQAVTDTTAVAATIFVDGQRSAHENPFAFLCRTGGAYGAFPWRILPQSLGASFGDRLVAWVGNYTSQVRNAHVIRNVGESPVNVTYTLSSWESTTQWKVVDYFNQSTEITSTQSPATVTFTLPSQQTALIKVR
jgi:hypothetical protein